MRMQGHAQHDDARYVPKELFNEWEERDPIKLFSNRLLEGLSDLSVAPEDVDVVIQTHLHFDHCGSLVQRSAGGAHGLTFPNAEVVVQKGEWEAAHGPDSRSGASYFPPEYYKAITDGGKLHLVEGEADIVPGVSVRQIGGHTLHHQCAEVTQGDDKVIFAGDFIPMTRHINTAYSMGFDMFPITTVEDKEAFLPQAADGDWTLVFVHDPDTPAAKVRRDGRKWTTEAVTI